MNTQSDDLGNVIQQVLCSGVALMPRQGNAEPRGVLVDDFERNLHQIRPAEIWRVMQVHPDRDPDFALACALLEQPTLWDAIRLTTGIGRSLGPVESIRRLAHELETDDALLARILALASPQGQRNLFVLDPLDWSGIPSLIPARDRLMDRIEAAREKPECNTGAVYSTAPGRQDEFGSIPVIQRLNALDAPPPSDQGAAAALLSAAAGVTTANEAFAGAQAAVEGTLLPHEPGVGDEEDAERIYRSLSPTDQLVTARLFRAITVCASRPDGLAFAPRVRDIHTLETWLGPALTPRLQPVLAAFSAQPRPLLDRGGAHEATGTVQLASATLVRTWARLQEWAELERRLRKDYERACLTLRAHRAASLPTSKRATAEGIFRRVAALADLAGQQADIAWTLRYARQAWFEPVSRFQDAVATVAPPVPVASTAPAAAPEKRPAPANTFYWPLAAGVFFAACGVVAAAAVNGALDWLAPNTSGQTIPLDEVSPVLLALAALAGILLLYPPGTAWLNKRK